MSPPLVEIENVTRLYDRGLVCALSQVSLSVAPGESMAIMGPSGSGKSTLLHLLCGLDRPTTGRVRFQGAEPGSLGQWARIRARRIGFVFQTFNLLAAFSAVENVEIPMFGVIPASRRRARALDLLERVGLADRAGHHPAELSGGERQRVAIARSLANSPALILADEPTGNLDSGASRQIMELLAGIHRTEGATLVIVTHDPGVACQAQRLVLLADGRIVNS